MGSTSDMAGDGMGGVRVSLRNFSLMNISLRMVEQWS